MTNEEQRSASTPPIGTRTTISDAIRAEEDHQREMRVLTAQIEFLRSIVPTTPANISPPMPEASMTTNPTIVTSGPRTPNANITSTNPTSNRRPEVADFFAAHRRTTTSQPPRHPIEDLNTSAPIIGFSNPANSSCGGPIGTPMMVLHVLPEDASIWPTMGGLPRPIPTSELARLACPSITCIADDCDICSPSPPAQPLGPGHVPVTRHMVRPNLCFMLPRPQTIQPPAEPFYLDCVDLGCLLCIPEYNAWKLGESPGWEGDVYI